MTNDVPRPVAEDDGASGGGGDFAEPGLAFSAVAVENGNEMTATIPLQTETITATEAASASRLAVPLLNDADGLEPLAPQRLI